MDFHAAMETFAEAWVAANTQTAVNSGQQPQRSMPLDDLPTMLSKEQLSETQTTKMKKSSTKPSALPPDALLPPLAAGKSVPVHCIVEQSVKSPPDGSSSVASTHTSVDMDSYAILPGNTLFSELVRAALLKLGYSCTEAVGAKGAVTIKNWKPLTFDTVTDNPDATVDEVLGELTSVATLRIRLCSAPKLNALDDVKEKLLQVLLQQAQGILITSGCPIEKTVLSLLSKGKSPSEITSEMKSAFEKWYKDQLVKISQHHTSPVTPGPIDLSMSEPVGQSTPVNYSLKGDSPSFASIMGKRMRTSFDPEHEIPRLHRWFQQTQHPTREQMVEFLKELNSLESRWGRKPLDLTNIIYWFKNARAAQRRATRTAETCPDDSVEADDIEDRLSPTPVENIPVLPNKNAIYIVKDPLYYSKDSKASAPELSSSPNAKLPKLTLPEENEKVSSDGSSKHELSPVSTSHDRGEDSRDEQPSPSEKNIPKPPRSVHSTTPDSYHSDESSKQPVVMNGNDISVTTENNNDKEVKVKTEIKMEDDNRSNHRNMDDDDDADDVMDDGEEDDDDSRDYQSVSNCSTPQPAAFPMHGVHMPGMPQHLSMHYIHPATAAAGHHNIYSQMAEAHLLSNHHQLNHSLNSQMNSSSSSSEERKKRSRIFIDPLSEIPKLEKWFLEDTHPSSFMIEKYTDDLNRSEYRQRFPKLEPKNVQLWFKNHRAKVKRARVDGGMRTPEDSNGLRSEDAYIHCQ